MRRQIAMVTGSRADFSHLADLAKAIGGDPALELQLIVTGAHLSIKHGMTVREIEEEGLPIADCVDIQLSTDSAAATVRSTGIAVIGLSESFARLKPDILVILGDRYEILAAAIAALLMSIPIVHIHGGEVTMGAFDESIRHAISKMASLHLVAAEPYRRRLIQMGEDPTRIFNFGAPALAAIRKHLLLSRAQLEHELGLTLGRPLVLLTFHPATRVEGGSLKELDALLAALDNFPQVTIIVTGSNADPNNLLLRDRLASWSAARSGPTHIVESLGRRRYLSLMAIADGMIGNSSSGYIEAPAFNLPVVDVGDRQTGRLAAACIQRVPANSDSIRIAFARALDPAFRSTHAGGKHPYDAGPFVDRAVQLLKNAPRAAELLRKPFCDLPEAAVA